MAAGGPKLEWRWSSGSTIESFDDGALVRLITWLDLATAKDRVEESRPRNMAGAAAILMGFGDGSGWREGDLRP